MGGPSDDLVVRIQTNRRMTDESDRKWINQWFEIVIPEVQNYDLKLMEWLRTKPANRSDGSIEN
jgi:hypothetical protein